MKQEEMNVPRDKHAEETFYSRLLPVPKNGGFKMEGYFVWCGSVIKGEDNRYHMFASRWPVSTGFPDGYRGHSEIVRAVSDTPEGPYQFQEVIISGREGDYWDSAMAHNPTIIKCGNTYVLYYIGAKSIDPKTRSIGYAYAESIAGPWQRRDTNISLVIDSNNPAVCVKPDGTGVLMAFRHSSLKIGIAEAPSFDGEYTVLREDIFPGIQLEDPYLFYNKDHYEMILEDNVGKLTGHVRYGAHLISENGVDDWKLHTPVIAYDHEIVWDDNSRTQADRRERPQLLMDESGSVTHLYTGVQIGKETWNIVQPLTRN